MENGIKIVIPEWLVYGFGGCLLGQVPWIIAFIRYWKQAINQQFKTKRVDTNGNHTGKNP